MMIILHAVSVRCLFGAENEHLKEMSHGNRLYPYRSDS